MVTVQQLITGYGPDFPGLEHLLGLEASEADELRLKSPSPALGRYLKSVKFMQDVCSGEALAMRSFDVATEHFIGLSEELEGYQGRFKDKKIVGRIGQADKIWLSSLSNDMDNVIRAEYLERFSDHDTAARTDLLKIIIGTQRPHLEKYLEGIHFPNTSEDNMSIAFGLIGNELIYGHLIPSIIDLAKSALVFGEEHEQSQPLVLPGLTHKQAAEPTTLGKKIATFVAAIDYHLQEDLLGKDGNFRTFTGKMNGAIGNFTTHYAAYPDINWEHFSQRFVESFNLTHQRLTHQSVTYAVEASILSSVANTLNQVYQFTENFIDMAATPRQWFVKKKKPGQKGSSLMPNKSNAWAMEGALEMLEESIDNLTRYAKRLPRFPHEGNMGRSYLMRQLGTILQPAFIALARIKREMNAYQPNLTKSFGFFEEYPGMSGSCMQTIMKREQIEGDAYRIIQDISINEDGSYANLEQYRAGLEKKMEEHNLPPAVRDELREQIDPRKLARNAAKLAREEQHTFVTHFREYDRKLQKFKR